MSPPPFPRRAPTLALAAATLALALVAAFDPAPADAQTPATRDARRAALAQTHAFEVHLTGPIDVEDARGLDLLVLDPDAHADVPDSLAGGPLVLAYLNVGERESYRWFADRVDPAWVLADNPHWPGHHFVDARAPGWQALVGGEVVPRALATGADGLFLDMLDVAERYPETAPGVAALVRDIRRAHPEILLVANRGLALWDTLGADLDGVLAEGVFAGYDPATGASRATPEPERDVLVAALRRFRDRTGGTALVLDYPGESRRLRDLSRRSATHHRFPLFLGRPSLSAAPPPPASRRAGW